MNKNYQELKKVMYEARTEEFMKKVKIVKEIPWGKGHKDLFGMTQHGKSFATMQTLGRATVPVLYFNTNGSKVTSRFTQATGANTKEQIEMGINRGKKINFIPSTKPAEFEKQLAALTEIVFEKERKMFFAIDEVHLFKKEGLQALRRIATAGLGRGYEGIFISQRPANVHNDLISQAESRVFFNLEEVDRQYLKRQGIPIDEMMNQIDRHHYLFSIYENGQVSGPYKIG